MNTFSTDSAAPVIEHPPSQCCVALCRCLQRINRRHGTSNPANKLASDLSFQKACLDRVDAGIAVEKLRGPLSGWQATPRRRAHADVDAVLIDFLSIGGRRGAAARVTSILSFRGGTKLLCLPWHRDHTRGSPPDRGCCCAEHPSIAPKFVATWSPGKGCCHVRAPSSSAGAPRRAWL
jgi:hypothetical protein